MKTREKTWKLKNKGFTLIEMIVTVAIIAIFSGVVVTFIGTGSSVYRSTSSSSKVQMETQETFDKIEDLIIDANRSLYYAYGSGSEIGAQITNDIKEKGGDGTNSSENKTFIVCNEYENSDGKTSLYIYDVLDWQKSDGKIYYSRRQYIAESSNVAGSDDEAGNDTENFSDESEENPVDSGNAGSGNVRNAQTLVERSVLASGVLDFRADVSKVKSDKIVRFQLSTENGKKQIQTLHSVSLRNNVDLKKPDDAFAKADATNVGIRIINAPDSMNPGESVMLVYGLTGNGSIDPTTVTWTIIDNKDNGRFPSQDHTNGRLTINENGSGYITVQVSAVSTTGQTVTSAVVTIKINATATPSPTLTPAPKQLILKQNANLLGAGQSYTLSDVVTSEMTYDNGSVKTDGYTLTWTSQPNLITVDGNTLTVSTDAGKDISTGKIKLKAIDSKSKLESNWIDITIARIDIQKPKGNYKVGQDRPKLQYIYKESGKAITSINDVDVSITNTDLNYKVGENKYFTSAEVGSWKANVTYDLSKRKGIGTVQCNSEYSVSESMNGDIIFSSGDEILAESNDYALSRLGVNLAHIYINKTINYSEEECELVWGVKGGNGTYVSYNEKEKSTLHIAAGEKGFILCVTMTVKNRLTNTERTYYAERNIKVAQKRLEFTSPPDNVKLMEEYDVESYVIVSYINNSEEQNKEMYTYSEERIRVEEYNTLNAGGSDIRETQKWTVIYPEKQCKIEAGTKMVPGVKIANSDFYFGNEKSITIDDPEINMVIHEKDNKINVKPGETINVWAELKINNHVVNDKYQIFWNDGIMFWNSASYAGNDNIQTRNIPGWLQVGKTVEVTVTVTILNKTYNATYNFEIT